MSATLGPIHHWLYNKIKIQNSIVENMISFTERLNLDLTNELERKFGSIDIRPLEELIDTTNIHGWLQECISIVEYRLAYAVTTILKQYPDTLENLKELFKNEATVATSISVEDSIPEIYKKLNDTLLDGMPCDHANTVISQDAKQVVWKRNACVHEQYWVSVGGDITNYYMLREEFIKGMLSNTSASFEKVDAITSKIKK